MDSYEIIEKSVPDPYVVGDEPMQTIYLGPGEERGSFLSAAVTVTVPPPLIVA